MTENLEKFLEDFMEHKKSSSNNYIEIFKQKIKKDIYEKKEILFNDVENEPASLIDGYVLDESEEKENTEENANKKQKAKKIFFCEFENCKKSFTNKQSLSTHIDVIHNKLIPFKCRFCEKRYKRAFSKTVHERIYHINYHPFKCLHNLCPKKFPSKQRMEAHYVKNHCT
jgi:hypothetical protein